MTDDKKNNAAAFGGGWRYQPVYQEEASGITLSLCECYFDKDGKLAAWSEDAIIAPQGETRAELSADLALMMVAVWIWPPVSFSSLRVGMTFQSTGIDVEDVIGAMNRSIKMGSVTS